MSDTVPTSRTFVCLVSGVLLTAFMMSGCYRQSRDERVPVAVEGVPAVVAADGEEDNASDDDDYAVRILEVRCYRIQEGVRVGERIRNFFAYSLVDEEAMDHYRNEFGNPDRRRGAAALSASDDDVTCEYVPSVNRDFTVLVDDRPVGLSSTDSSGFLRFANLEVGENATVVAVDSVTGERVVVQSSDNLPFPDFASDEAEVSPVLDGPPPAGSTDDAPDDSGSDEVDFSEVPPGGPFDDDEVPFETIPGAFDE